MPEGLEVFKGGLGEGVSRLLGEARRTDEEVPEGQGGGVGAGVVGGLGDYPGSGEAGKAFLEGLGTVLLGSMGTR